MVICLQQGADCLHMVQLMPLHPKTPSYLASFKSRLVLTFWYWLTKVVLEKRLLNGCSSSSVVRDVTTETGEHQKSPLQFLTIRLAVSPMFTVALLMLSLLELLLMLIINTHRLHYYCSVIRYSPLTCT